MAIKTKITEMLGIEHPIIMAGMNWATTPRIVAAVSNAGGLGILGAAAFTKESIKETIAEIRSQTDKPFGVNLTLALPGAKDLVQVVLEQKVPVINVALGRVADIIKAVHGYGGKVLATVAMAKHAVYYEKDGADAIIATGYEAGAHSGNAGGLVLIPSIVSKVKVPVIAAGGFTSGKGLVAALALGAGAISMGTRFAITQESDASDGYKEGCLKATEEDTILSDRFDGINCRVVKTKRADVLLKRRFAMVEAVSSAFRFKRELDLSWGEIIKGGLSMSKAQGRSITEMPILAAGLSEMQRGYSTGDGTRGLFLAGQSCGGINDIPTCKEVIDKVMAEAEEAMAELGKKFKSK